MKAHAPDDDGVVLGRALNVLREHLAAIAKSPEVADRPLRLPPDRGSALARLRESFGLDAFETSLLLLAVGVELLPGFEQLCGALSRGEGAAAPTFELALAALPEPTWRALTPEGNLRRYGLVELEDGPVLTRRAVRVDERVLHALLGHDVLDGRLSRRARALDGASELPSTLEALAASLCGVTRAHLVGGTVEAAVEVAARAAVKAGLRPWSMPVSAIPVDAAERETLSLLWSREARLGRAVLVVVGRAGTDDGRVGEFLARTEVPTLFIGGDLPTDAPPMRKVKVPALPFAETLVQWRRVVRNEVDDGVLRELAAQFQLGPQAMAGAASTLPKNGAFEPAKARGLLWNACRAFARPRLADLAQHVDVRERAAKLVLPERQSKMLDALVAQVRQRATVHHGWGFAEIEGRGAGTSAVFAGPSGTGKTMAAEMLAHRLELDLFRIDLSAVVSKYIGETEENLRAVFDAAESGGAILLFDEADALFGKRTEVRDSHDRHANIEVSYLLQRMEAYSGLAILTTNLRKSMDDAFLRRVQFIVDFPFPERPEREQIWRGIFPSRTPRDGLDYDKLAQLSVAGGNIRSIARNAAYLAADEGLAVGMSQLLEAARLEYAKLGRSLAPAEVQGWVS